MNSKAISGTQTHFLLPSKRCSFPTPFNTHMVQISTRRPVLRLTAKASVYAPAPVKETLYELLGIPESGTLSEIKKAYKRMALKYHPDVSPPDRTEEYTTMFIRVQGAYETLSDPDARARYDTCIAKGLHMAFSGRDGSGFCGDTGGWKSRWQVQVDCLKWKSTVSRSKVDSSGRISWAAQIRKKRAGSPP